MKAVERGWAVELRDRVSGKWFILSSTFERLREDAIAARLAYVPARTCPHCWWREQQRNGKARCVRVVLKEEE